MKTKTTHTPTPWNVEGYFDANPPYGWPAYRIKGQLLNCSIEPNESLREEVKANAAYIVRAVNSHEELLDACKAVDIYFKSLCEQWAANDGRVASESGTIINASADVERLCEIAAQKVSEAIARAEGRE